MSGWRPKARITWRRFRKQDNPLEDILKSLPSDNPGERGGMMGGPWDKDLKLEFAPQDKTGPLQDTIDEVCLALGHKEVWYTDESLVGDFDEVGWDDGDDPEEIDARNEITRKFASKVLGVDVRPEDYLWEVAERVIAARTKALN